MADVVYESVLTCPRCGYAERVRMPGRACIFFHECGNCHALLRPQPGDCCVFCSYGSVPCPPVQRRNARCVGSRHSEARGQRRAAAHPRGPHVQ
ncbi:MAG: GDCCVxC domain-containing (seleno)protein [Rhodanobacteraceae bacterium]